MIKDRNGMDLIEAEGIKKRIHRRIHRIHRRTIQKYTKDLVMYDFIYMKFSNR